MERKKLKLKEGEFGKIILNSSCHGLEKGTIVKVSRLCLYPESTSNHYEVKDNNGNRWWCNEEDIETNKKLTF